MEALDDFYFLCLNCGFITAFYKWSFWIYADNGVSKLPASDHNEAYCQCPVCEYDHQNDGTGPGFETGRLTQMTVRRAKKQDELLHQWQEMEEKVFGL